MTAFKHNWQVERASPVPLFVKIWLLVILSSTFVITNYVKGATPGFILALLSPVVALFVYKGRRLSNYLELAFFVIIGFGLIVILSTISGILGSADQNMGLTFINPNAILGVRISILTQSIYMLCCLLLLAWTASFYEPSWDRYIAAGAWLFLTYGYLEWLIFFATGRDFDFLSNREFGAGEMVNGFAAVGNQSTNILGKTMLRFKSLTGEASMFCLVAVPLTWWAFFTKRHLLATVAAVAVVLAFSTTGYLALAFAVILLFVIRMESKNVIVAMAVLGMVVFVYMIPPIRELFQDLVFSKLGGEGASGAERLGSLNDSLAIFGELPLVTQIFGIGFGSVRELATFQTLLINVGVIGLAVFLAAFLVPTLLSWKNPVTTGARGAVLLSLLCLMLSVPELTMMPHWLWLGMIIRYVRIEKKLVAPKRVPQRFRNQRIASASPNAL